MQAPAAAATPNLPSGVVKGLPRAAGARTCAPLGACIAQLLCCHTSTYAPPSTCNVMPLCWQRRYVATKLSTQRQPPPMQRASMAPYCVGTLVCIAQPSQAGCEASRMGMLSGPRLLQQRQLGLEAQHLCVQARDLRAHRRRFPGQVLVHDGLRHNKPGLESNLRLVSLVWLCVVGHHVCLTGHSLHTQYLVHHTSSPFQTRSRRVWQAASLTKAVLVRHKLY